MSATDPHNTRPPTIAVIPMNYAGEALVIRDAAHLTLPTGTIAAGESSENAARRILQAATGFNAKAVFALDMIMGGSIHLFLARNLEPARSMTDAIYQDATERVALDDIDTLITSRRISDPTVIEALSVARETIAGTSHSDQEGADHG